MATSFHRIIVSNTEWNLILAMVWICVHYKCKGAQMFIQARVVISFWLRLLMVWALSSPVINYLLDSSVSTDDRKNNY